MGGSDLNRHPREEMEENMLAREHKSVEDWVIDIKSNLKNVSRQVDVAVWNKRSIYRIPEGFGDSSRRKAYNPQMVSFGPYHHGKRHLKQMEEHKYRALLHFLGRAKTPVDGCVAAVERVVPQLMESYDQLDEEWTDRVKFLKLMILDGCFMLEIFRNSDNNISNDYADNDPIFSKHGRLCKLPNIKRDMLMIENQLPLLLLKTLVAVERRAPQDDESINKLVFEFFTSCPLVYAMGPCLHVLDVVRKSMLQDTSTAPNPAEVIWPATELHEAGIEFKMIKTHSLKEVKFENGTLTLPQMTIDDATESKFLNLMAFEQLHAGAGTEVSSYVSFMDNVIDTERDVILLNKEKIIKNFVGTDKAVAKIFNGISQDLSIDPESSLGKVHVDVTKYCNKPMNQWRANLVHTYFRSPWAFLSLLAAIFLLGITVIQFVYGIIDFYHPKS
ncbi:UPF0481 protein At3g47200-like [Magnolia sinica]|uniref:UPF0481 protein At3g47200-like n=1 Tax=Magnolia sinica TaxID=86752 RepID=UPI0026583409|nr:UPF0481 protein At3g47200-like [Magnolia sinica]